MNLFEDLMSAAEAAQKWNLDESSIRKACRDGRIPGTECRKFGKQWIVTNSGMESAFGLFWKRNPD